MKKSKRIIFWILTAIFVLLAIATLPHFSGFVAMVTAVLLVPLEQWQAILQKTLKKVVRIILITVLAITTILTMPEMSSTKNDKEPATDVATTSTMVVPGYSGTVVSTLHTTTKSLLTTKKETSTQTSVGITTTKKLSTTTKATTTKKNITTTKAPTATRVTTTVKKTTTTQKVTTKITTTKKTETTANKQEVTYVLNTSSKKFHSIYCRKLPTKNREDTNKSREEIIELGYEPCGLCKP